MRNNFSEYIMSENTRFQWLKERLLDSGGTPDKVNIGNTLGQDGFVLPNHIFAGVLKFNKRKRCKKILHCINSDRVEKLFFL